MATTNNKAGGKRRGIGRRAGSEGGPSAHRRSKPGVESRRAEHRLADTRVQTALGKAGADRAWLDEETAKVQALIAEWTAEREAQRAAARARGEKLPPLPLDDRTNRTPGDIERWNVGQAGQLLDDGYSLAHVCRLTGWGGWWFKDRVGNDGYVRPVAESRWSA